MNRKKISVLVTIVVLLLVCTSCSLLSTIGGNSTVGNTQVGGNISHLDLDDLDTSNPASVVASKTVSSCVRIIVTLSSGTEMNGAGFIITTDGYIVTNRHVVVQYRSGNDLPSGLSDHRIAVTQIKAVFADNTYLEADEIMFSDNAAVDLAILKIKPSSTTFTPIELDASSQLYYGQDAYTFGNPEGIGLLFSHATISSPAHSFKSNGTDFKDIIMLDSNVNHGNSGGVLLNSKGRAIGVVYGRIESTGSTTTVNNTYGIGCALPIKEVISFINKSTYSSIIKYVQYSESTESDSGSEISSGSSGSES